tara:strand:+ start:1455 stop:2387 length:933 start_codon:yes stop_codon:yes gene_type:complete
MGIQYNTSRLLKIGTRGSPLALAQAHETRDRLMAAHGMAAAQFEIVVIKTTGDAVQDRSLSEIGGKGLFTKEIEEALLDGSIDIAVHSMKDMPTILPDGLALSTYLPREDMRDAFISRRFAGIAELPMGAVVGTSSLRRRAQLLARRPDLRVVEFRGNVQTRLRKLDEGVAEASFLACAGLNRLGMAEIAKPIDARDMLPAVAQGAIGIEQRIGDDPVSRLLALLDHGETRLQLAAERAFLAALDGSCRTPIAALAQRVGDRLQLHGEILRPDGSIRHAGVWDCAPDEAAAMGAAAGQELKQRAGPGFLD